MRQHTFSLRRGGQIFTVVLVVALTLVRAAAVHLLQGESVTMNLSGLLQERPNLPRNTCQEIGEVLVRFGDAVRKDQTLFLIESPEAETAAATALADHLARGLWLAGFRDHAGIL